MSCGNGVEAGLRTSWSNVVPIAFPDLAHRSSGCAPAPIDDFQVTAAGLCRTLTDFPIIPLRGTSIVLPRAA
jgi:hypothetical protein